MGCISIQGKNQAKDKINSILDNNVIEGSYEFFDKRSLRTLTQLSTRK